MKYLKLIASKINEASYITCADFILAALGWCVYNLARHQECQNKCREEVQEILGDRNNVTWYLLRRMKITRIYVKIDEFR